MASTPKFKQGDQNPVGMIIASMLTEAQFQSINGTQWILADGRSVTGSSYATITGSSTAPDLRGMVLRGKNNGRSDGNQNPDGESTLGTYQADTNKGHGHVINWGDGVSGSTNYHSYIPSISIGWSATGNPGTYGGDPGMVQQSGGNESRMRNVTINHFIKIN